MIRADIPNRYQYPSRRHANDENFGSFWFVVRFLFYPPSIFKYLQIYEIIVWLKDRHPNGYIPGNIPKTRQYHYGVGVLWVAVHPTYDPDTREYNVALLTTIWAFQFTSSMYQICLPMPDASDTNIGRKS